MPSTIARLTFQDDRTFLGAWTWGVVERFSLLLAGVLFLLNNLKYRIDFNFPILSRPVKFNVKLV